MPETLLQAEEVARTVDSISQQETSTKEGSQIERLIEAITCSQQVPAQATGTNASLNISQQQSLQTQMETLTQIGLSRLCQHFFRHFFRFFLKKNC